MSETIKAKIVPERPEPQPGYVKIVDFIRDGGKWKKEHGEANPELQRLLGQYTGKYVLLDASWKKDTYQGPGNKKYLESVTHIEGVLLEANKKGVTVKVEFGQKKLGTGPQSEIQEGSVIEFAYSEEEFCSQRYNITQGIDRLIVGLNTVLPLGQ